MLKLYYSPGSCSMASHILLEELGRPYQAVSVNLRDPARPTSTGEDFRAVSPQGYVPALQLDSGEVLCETPALLAWLGELDPGKNLMPPAGTLENFRVREWLAFLATELHKNCSPLFRPNTPEATQQSCREILAKRLAHANAALSGRDYLVGNRFTPADAYLFVILSWFGRLQIDLAAYPNLQALQARVGARASVQKVLRDEGLVKAA
jgi:glutathione S-transferase